LILITTYQKKYRRVKIVLSLIFHLIKTRRQHEYKVRSA